MTQIALGIAIGTFQSAKDECWFCKEEKSSDNPINDVDSSPDTSDSESEDAVPENDLHNDASKLGVKLGNKPEWTVKCPDKGETTKVLSAAHHCIPGNASFKKAYDSGLVDFVKKGGDFNLQSDIGYSINHESNGVWLPGNYYVRKGNKPYDKNWSSFSKSFKDEYAKRAINVSKMQFHDAHSRYNKKVLKTLESVMSKIDEPEDKCPMCGEEYDNTRPPFGLVGRLDFISKQHKNMISNISKKKGKKYKYVKSDYYTSSRVKTYFGIK